MNKILKIILLSVLVQKILSDKDGNNQNNDSGQNKQNASQVQNIKNNEQNAINQNDNQLENKQIENEAEQINNNQKNEDDQNNDQIQNRQNENKDTKKDNSFMKNIDQQFAEEVQKLQIDKEIQRKMETEANQLELKVFDVFKDIIESKVAIVHNVSESNIQLVFKSGKFTEISQYKNLRSTAIPVEEVSFYKLKNHMHKTKVVQQPIHQDNLYQQILKMSKGEEHLINMLDSQNITEQLHQLYTIQDIKDLDNINLQELPLTREEIMNQGLRKQTQKKQMSEVSLNSSSTSQQNEDEEKDSEEEYNQSMVDIQKDNAIDVDEFIDADKSELSENIIWDPSEKIPGLENYFKDKEEYQHYVAKKGLDKFETEMHLINEERFLKNLKKNPRLILHENQIDIRGDKVYQQLQNKPILDLTLSEFLDLSQHTIKKIYDDQNQKRQLQNLEHKSNQKRKIKGQTSYNRQENKSYQDFLKQNDNDIEQAEKEQNIQNQQKKIQGTKYIDLINKVFYPEKGKKDKKKCDVRFKYQFIKKPKIVNKNYILVKNDIKQYCPSIIKSCCTHEEIDYFFKKASESLQKPIDELSNMKLFFKFLKVTPLKTWKQFIVNNYAKVRKCLPQHPAILIKSLQFMQKNFPKIIKTYTQLIKNITENLYSFYCSTCNLYSQGNFVYENRTYFLNFNQKEIANFLRFHKNSFMTHSIYALGNFFECFQFNLHLNDQDTMSFILPSSYLNFSAVENNPVYAYYESDSFREYFDQNFFLFSKRLILWGNFLKLVQDTLKGQKFQQRLHIYQQKKLILPYQKYFTKFNLTNILVKISKGNKGNIMQFNKMNMNNKYFKKQNEIIKDLLEEVKTIKNSLILNAMILVFVLLFN